MAQNRHLPGANQQNQVKPRHVERLLRHHAHNVRRPHNHRGPQGVDHRSARQAFGLVVFLTSNDHGKSLVAFVRLDLQFHLADEGLAEVALHLDIADGKSLDRNACAQT
jgi:hypothetical protein